MKFLNKMERKFGRYAIHNLMYYIIILQIVGIVLNSLSDSTYYFVQTYLALDVGRVLQGQIWRLFTFIIADAGYVSGIADILFAAIELYFYYFVGNLLENNWGAFRFNIYYFSGILFNVIAAFILYFVFKEIPLFSSMGLSTTYIYGLTYINYSLFFAAATIYPDMQILMMLVFPLKVKYVAYFYAALIGISMLQAIKVGNVFMVVAIIVALLNFLIYFFMLRKSSRRFSPRQIRRKRTYKKQLKVVSGAPRHKCAVCGRTEEDDENLEFRFCSRCEGNYEYCMEHLFTHEHVKKH